MATINIHHGRQAQQQPIQNQPIRQQRVDPELAWDAGYRAAHEAQERAKSKGCCGIQWCMSKGKFAALVLFLLVAGGVGFFLLGHFGGMGKKRCGNATRRGGKGKGKGDDNATRTDNAAMGATNNGASNNIPIVNLDDAQAESAQGQSSNTVNLAPNEAGVLTNENGEMQTQSLRGGRGGGNRAQNVDDEDEVCEEEEEEQAGGNDSDDNVVEVVGNNIADGAETVVEAVVDVAEDIAN